MKWRTNAELEERAGLRIVMSAQPLHQVRLFDTNARANVAIPGAQRRESVSILGEGLAPREVPGLPPRGQGPRSCGFTQDLALPIPSVRRATREQLLRRAQATTGFSSASSKSWKSSAAAMHVATPDNARTIARPRHLGPRLAGGSRPLDCPASPPPGSSDRGEMAPFTLTEASVHDPETAELGCSP